MCTRDNPPQLTMGNPLTQCSLVAIDLLQNLARCTSHTRGARVTQQVKRFSTDNCDRSKMTEEKGKEKKKCVKEKKIVYIFDVKWNVESSMCSSDAFHFPPLISGVFFSRFSAWSAQFFLVFSFSHFLIEAERKSLSWFSDSSWACVHADLKR